MKVYFIKVLLTISTIQYISGATDYCKLCSNHIACNHTTNFISECPDNAVIVDLSQSDKDFFVNVHNELRSNIAGGMIPGFSSAANMSAVVSISKMTFSIIICCNYRSGIQNLHILPN